MYNEPPKSHVNVGEVHTFWVRVVWSPSLETGSVIETVTLFRMGSQKCKTSTQMGDYACLRKKFVGLVPDEN